MAVSALILWHNPRCSKSRAALNLLQEAGHEVSVRRYLEDPPTLSELQAVQDMLGVSAIDMLRTGERVFRESGLSKMSPEEELLAAMVSHPILIERPVALFGSQAVIGRPPERVLGLV
ncbi:MAG: arsenate reductase (glutaredoxin) [Pseudomonadota bacterium]